MKFVYIVAALIGIAAPSLTFVAANTAVAVPARTSATTTRKATPKTRATKPTTRSVSFRIQGMSCGRCAMSITKALQQIEGVVRVNVSFDQKQAHIDFDPAKTTSKRLARAIEKIGFQATPMTRRTK